MRYDSMDFLRSIAIIFVVLAHSVLSYGAPAYIAPLQLGGIGVDLFFVLSGWLLGGQLFKEAERTQSIDIKRFWIRRWMRTLPAYYAVLVLSVAQRYINLDDVRFPLEYFVFLQNYNESLSFFSISWSLCVEEQFYLFIAPLLALMCRFNKQQTTIVLIIFLMIPLIVRENGWATAGMPVYSQMDGCIFGVLLAQLRNQYSTYWEQLVKIIVPLSIISLVIFILLFIGRYDPRFGLGEPDNLLLALVFGSWVVLANANDVWRNRLYFPGANYIATRSYGIYLLHPEVLALLKRFALEWNFLLYFIASMIGSIILAEVLYRCLEKPFMDAREKFKASRSQAVPVT